MGQKDWNMPVECTHTHKPSLSHSCLAFNLGNKTLYTSHMQPTEGEAEQMLQQALLLIIGSKSPGTSAKLCIYSNSRCNTARFKQPLSFWCHSAKDSTAFWKRDGEYCTLISIEGDLNGMLCNSNDWDKRWAALLGFNCKCHGTVKTFNIDKLGG